TALKDSIGETATVSGKVVTIEFAEANEYIITLGAQVRMDSLTVYSAAGGETSEKEVTTYSDSKFVIRCGIDAAIEDIAAVESYGICVSAGGNTVYYDSESANSWKLDETNNVYYVVINLGDIINDTAKLGTEFTVQAYFVYDGTAYISTSSKTYSVASMIKEYKANGYDVTHLYNYLVSKNLIVEEVA
ncbi:MAG: hypothetical protein IJX09_03465, partial [Clostridia bacterium]|nr:hypothetical protein [Clostridia bacterium]